MTKFKKLGRLFSLSRLRIYLERRRNSVYVARGSYVSRKAHIGAHTRINNASYISECIIGKYCAIGGRLVVRSENHKTEYLNIQDNFQRNVLKSKVRVAGLSKGTVQIGNSVWIGDSVIILSGVVIGNGAVVGAGSVVTRSVPAFSVVVGSPARVLKYRFGENVMAFIERIGWWDWSEQMLLTNSSLFDVDLAAISAQELLELEKSIVWVK